MNYIVLSCDSVWEIRKANQFLHNLSISPSVKKGDHQELHTNSKFTFGININMIVNISLPLSWRFVLQDSSWVTRRSTLSFSGTVTATAKSTSTTSSTASSDSRPCSVCSLVAFVLWIGYSAKCEDSLHFALCNRTCLQRSMHRNFQLLKRSV